MDDRPEEEDERPWEEAGGMRRDVLPHRAVWLRRLAITAMVLGFSSVVLIVPALIGLPLGIAVWRMASQDLPRCVLGRWTRKGKLRPRVPKGQL